MSIFLGMHRFFWIFFLMPFLSLYGEHNAADLALRRIEQLHQSSEHALLQKAILNFLELHPLHSKGDSLKALLFREYMLEKSYGPALGLLQKIQDQHLLNELNIMKWEALYQTAQYETLYEELHLTIPYLPNEQKAAASFYFAESAFREALTLSHYVEGEEKAIELCLEALPFYEKVKEHALFGTHARLGMAEIYRMTGSHEKASSLYLSLSEEANEKEDLLFHAAIACTQFDPKKACPLFSKIARMQGKYKQEATYQWMQLLAAQHHFQELLEYESFFTQNLKNGHLPNFNFYCGMYCAKELQFEKALTYFEKALEGGLVYPYDKEALTQYARSALSLKREKELKDAYSLMVERYPTDAGEIAIAFAHFLKQQENLTDSLALFHAISLCPYPQKILQEAYREHLNLLVQAQEWKEALTQSKRYYELTDQKEVVAEQQIQIALKIGDRSQLVQLLEEGIKEKLFQQKNLHHKVTLLAHCYLEAGKPEKSLALLDQYRAQNQNNPEFLKLLTFSLVEAKAAPSTIIEVGEHLLELESEGPAIERIHLYLFNAYLAEAKEAAEPHELKEKAENHLFRASQFIPVSLQNRLWLVHRFEEKGGKESEITTLLTPLFQSADNSLKYPEEALIFIQALLSFGKESEATPLLKLMMHERERFQESTRARLQLLYASSLENQGEISEAYYLYETMLYELNGECLEKAQLSFCRIALSYPELKSDREKALALLKNLWVKKCVESEPLHLEAGIEYTVAMCADRESALEKKKLWDEMIHHFTHQEDIWSKDYHQTLLESSEKKQIHAAFVRYMRGRLLLEEGFANEKSLSYKEKSTCALQLFQSLTQEPGCPQYLKRRAQLEIREGQCR
jgi:tetratricopeptide (TPR) repeat protein